jgi:large subunit ribosomal protein L24
LFKGRRKTLMKIKRGDNVMVLSGNDKGKTGEVLDINPKEQKVVVKGVNIRKKHVKPRKAGEEGGIIPSEFPIDSSNVNIICPKCGKTAKIGYKVEDGKKVRICKKCGAELK